VRTGHAEWSVLIVTKGDISKFTQWCYIISYIIYGSYFLLDEPPIIGIV
jgi:hypothetical protein